MSSKDRYQKRARAMQKRTGWAYSECLRLSRSEISEEGLNALIAVRTQSYPSPGERFAATAAVGIECPHGYDVCPRCDSEKAGKSA